MFKRGYSIMEKNKIQNLVRVCVVAGFMLFFAASFFFIEARIAPIVDVLGTNKVSSIANKAIYESVAAILSENKVGYEDLVTIEKNDSGEVSAISSNVIKINQLKSEITVRILEHIEQNQTNVVEIPIGNIISGDLLSGRGPKIPIRVIPVGNVQVSVRNQFSGAGINQTRHQIIMDISLNMAILMPIKNASTRVNVPIMISETVIVGVVPNTYTNVYGDDGTIIEKLNDY